MNNRYLALELEAIRDNTEPERLAELADMDDKLACLVAQNVNTSPETLKQLATYKQDSILKTTTNKSDESTLFNP